jgi:hypothetical protein
MARTSTRAKQRCVLASFRGHLDELITPFHPDPGRRCRGVIWLCLLAVHTSQTVRSRKEAGDVGHDIAALGDDHNSGDDDETTGKFGSNRDFAKSHPGNEYGDRWHEVKQ